MKGNCLFCLIERTQDQAEPLFILVVCLENRHIPETFKVSTYASSDLEFLRSHTPLDAARWADVIDNRYRQNLSPRMEALAEQHLLHTPHQARQRWIVVNDGWAPTRRKNRAIVKRDDLIPELVPSHPEQSARTVQVSIEPDTFVATDASGRGTWSAVVQSAEGVFRIGGHGEHPGTHLGELYAIVCALEWLPPGERSVVVLTDSQSAAGLIGRRTQKPADKALRARYMLAAKRHRKVRIEVVPRSDPRIREADRLAARLAQALRTPDR